MPHAFAKLAYTKNVQDQQQAHGSKQSYDQFLKSETETHHQLGPKEITFINQRDGFYQATTSETGWPYVQFRGGPKGFLKVLDETTIAYANYRGNRQYISNGNLFGNKRISLILMDYPNQRRLKILGTTKTITLKEDEPLINQLMPKNYKAIPEHAIIITVNGFDWNCPQHIPQRLTMEEVAPLLSEYQDRIDQLSKENRSLKSQLNAGH